MTTEFGGLHPLQFTSRSDDPIEGPREEFYLYRTPSGAWSWFCYDTDIVSPTWPPDATVGVNVIRIPDGSDPAEVGRWLEDNGGLLRDWARGRIATDVVQDQLWHGIRVRHCIGDGLTVEKDLNAWKNEGRPDSFVRFLMRRRGATVERCDHLCEYFIRWCERDPFWTRYIWVPLMTVGWMGRRR